MNLVDQLNFSVDRNPYWRSLGWLLTALLAVFSFNALVEAQFNVTTGGEMNTVMKTIALSSDLANHENALLNITAESGPVKVTLVTVTSENAFSNSSGPVIPSSLSLPENGYRVYTNSINQINSLVL